MTLSFLCSAHGSRGFFNFRKISNLGARFAFSALASTLFTSLCWQEANGAMPGRLFDQAATVLCPENKDGQKAQASSIISGSPWPGVIDHLLQRPLPEVSPAAIKHGIHINYPSFGLRNVDQDIRSWAENIADSFESHLDLNNISIASPEIEMDVEINRFLQDDDLNSDVAQEDRVNGGNYELWGNYSISRPSPASVSITYELWNYRGDGQGNLDIITLNYNLLNSQRLGFVDIFEKPDMALDIMSAWSRKQLEIRLGAGRRTKMLHDGTEPLIENFSSLTLTPDGICINFQPWQVAPWAAGIQKVEIPLHELMPSGPLLALWGK